MADFSNAEFAKVFNAGIVKIMEEAIARAVLPLRDRIAALEEREKERETPRTKIRAV
jgi:hypothetical protein